MVRLTRIYTRGGDRGETSLGNGVRVAKDSLRVEAFGAVDETNACIGLARPAHIGRVGRDAGAHPERPVRPGRRPLHAGRRRTALRGALRVVPEQVRRLEAEIDAMNAGLTPLNSFVLPGGSAAAAALHLARTTARRAERAVTTLAREEPVGEAARHYINRLSDHLFVAARLANDKGAANILWVPGANR